MIHDASARNETIRETFQNQEDFFSLRIEPYLSFTAGRHPSIAPRIHKLIEMLNTHEPVLVHGDVSPKTT